MIEEPECHSFIARKDGTFLIDDIFVEERIYKSRYMRYLEEGKLYRLKLEIYDLLSSLDTDDRKEVIWEFCVYCGKDKQGSFCYCMRDE